MTKTIDALTAQTMEESKRCARKMSLLQELTSLKEKYGAVFDEVLNAAGSRAPKTSRQRHHPKTGLVNSVRAHFATTSQPASARETLESASAAVTSTSKNPAASVAATLSTMERRGELMRVDSATGPLRYLPTASILPPINSETEAEGET